VATIAAELDRTGSIEQVRCVSHGAIAHRHMLDALAARG
jgi:hypothetical protein